MACCCECQIINDCNIGYFGQKDEYIAKATTLFVKKYGEECYISCKYRVKFLLISTTRLTIGDIISSGLLALGRQKGGSELCSPRPAEPRPRSYGSIRYNLPVLILLSKPLSGIANC